jgi:uncharacterized repeat protein (TIGR01451 family)
MHSEISHRISRARALRLAAVAALLGSAVLLALMLRGSAPSEAQAAPVDPADLALTKSDSPDPVAQGGTLTYTIQVTNNGPDPAVNTVVSDDLVNDLSFVSATSTAGSCDNQGGKVTCNLGNLANAETATITLKATVKDKAGNQVSNTASVSSDTADPSSANNSDTEGTTVTPASQGPSCRNKAATIVGTGGNDVLTGTAKNDVIVGFAGDDTIRSGDGKDIVCANGGTDLVNTGASGDFAKGGGGPDLIKGRSGGDELRGNRGRDRLRGNGGADLLAGGRGLDSCRGGAGADTLRSCP